MKKKRLLIYLLSSFAIGFLGSFLVYQGLWFKITNGFSQIAFYYYPLMIVGIFYLTLTFHELGHLLSFVFQGVSIRALYLTIFVFYKQKRFFRFKINFKLWKLFGGMVIPNFNEIEVEEDYQKLVTKFKKALIAGPYATIITMILTIMLFFIIWIFSNNHVLIAMMLLIMIGTVLFSMLYIKASKLHTDTFYGDFVAYDKMKEDLVFQLVEIDQYTLFSLKNQEKTMRFLQDKREKLLCETTMRYDIFYLTMFKSYIEAMIVHNNPLPQEIEKKIENLNLTYILRYEQGLELALSLVRLAYHQGSMEKVYERLNVIETHMKQDKVSLYLVAQTKYMMHFIYEIDIDYHDEQAFLFEGLLKEEPIEKMTYKPFMCIFYMDIEEKNE